MIIGDGLFSSTSSSNVATLLDYLAAHPGTHGVLEAEQNQRHSGQHPPALTKRKFSIQLDVSRPNTTLADGRQIIRCLTDSGERLDIILSSTSVREISPALIIVEAD